jgi:hypothetical protein
MEGEFIDETVLFMMQGTSGLDGGGTLVLTVAIQDSTQPGEDISHTIFIASSGQSEDIRWSTFVKLEGDDVGFIQLSEKQVTAETTFDDDMPGGAQTVSGTLQGACP